MKEHYILNERYRPSTLDGYICPTTLKTKIEGWLEDNQIPHLLLHGQAGSGKTTLAKILVKNLDCDFLYLNATDNRSMDDIRSKILPFVSSASFKGTPKIVILDEATHILKASQVLLLNMIETYSVNSRFILTGNYAERLIEPLRSRLEQYDLKPPSKAIVAEHLQYILTEEKISFEIEDIVNIVNSMYPDIRGAINTCQKCIVDGKLVLDKSLLITNEYMNLVLEELKQNKPSWTKLRQIIIDSGVKDFENLYKFLFENWAEYASGRGGSIAIILNEHLFQAESRIDKEINLASAFAKIIEIL